MRRLKRNADWNWLNACIGVIEGDPNPVEAYLSSGGDPARTLTASEVAILNRSSAFDVGHTLVHLAIRSVLPVNIILRLINKLWFQVSARRFISSFVISNRGLWFGGETRSQLRRSRYSGRY